MNHLASLAATPAGRILRAVRWWSAAERSYLLVIRLYPKAPEWHYRLGQVRERRRDLSGAEEAYRRAIALDDRVGVYHFRLGCVLERKGDAAAANDAYTSAIICNPREVRWYQARALFYEKQQRWGSAAEDYRTAADFQPARKVWYLTASNAYERAPDPLSAITVLEAARARFGDGDRHLLRRLATAHESAGEWSKASDLLRTLLTSNPQDVASNYRLAKSLEKLSRVPFELKSGQIVPSSFTDGHAPTSGSPDVPNTLLDEAIKHFRLALTGQPERVTAVHRLASRLARGKRLFRLATRRLRLATRVHQQFARPETRLRRVYELGQMYERHGRLVDAAESFRSAVAGLEAVDSIWVHKAEPAWRFRLAYVNERLTGSGASDNRLHRVVVNNTSHDVVGALDHDVGGFFEALITDVGLQVQGFVLPDGADSVEILVDGHTMKRTAVNTSVWLRTFLFEISHRVLDELPSTAKLGVAAGDRPLVCQGGGRWLEIHVPDGSGRLAELLSTGYSVSKKGVLARPLSERRERDLRYLSAYSNVQRRFEQLTGKRLFLLYGTLLGCYRDGALIAGDDDFDVSYVADATDPVDVKQESQQIALSMLRSGFDICMTTAGRLFKIRYNDAWLDVNPVWFYLDRAWSFDSHRLVREDFEPVRTISVLGHEVYAPNDIEAFLAENYGADWRTPQPDFRYYRNESDRRILRRSWLTPREAREFARLAEAERKRHPGAGRFLGIGDPADPGFG